MLLQLPVAEFGGKPVALPCPESDVIRLAEVLAVRQSDLSDEVCRQRVAEFLRSAPTLFLFSVAAVTGENCKADLLDWVIENLAERLKGSEFLSLDSREHKPQNLIRALNSYAKAKKPTRCVEALKQLVSAFKMKLKKRRRETFFATSNIEQHVRAMWGGVSPLDRDELVERWLHHRLNLEVLFTPLDCLQSQRKEQAERLAESKLLAMKQLAYGASHEINNPLANIATRAQTLLVDETNPARRQKIAVIYEQAMRAHEMITDLMLFGHPAKPKFESVCLESIVGQVMREFRTTFRDRGIRSNVAKYPGGERVEADPTQVMEAFKALVRNAQESVTATNGATQKLEHPAIQVRVWPESESVMAIGVSDNGAGVTDDAKKHLMDPFYSGREAGRGLGFGLSKAWTIVNRLHGGQIRWVDRSTDSTFKTEFRILLPVRQPMQNRDLKTSDSKTSDSKSDGAVDAPNVGSGQQKKPAA